MRRAGQEEGEGERGKDQEKARESKQDQEPRREEENEKRASSGGTGVPLTSSQVVSNEIPNHWQLHHEVKNAPFHWNFCTA